MKTLLIVWIVASPIVSIVIGWLVRERFGDRGRIMLDIRSGDPYVGSASLTEIDLRSDHHEHARRNVTVIGRRAGPPDDA